MQDKTINNALLALRKQIIRGGGDGLDHVQALLEQRGVVMPRVLPAKRLDVAKRGHMRLWLLEALSERPMRLAELTEAVALKVPHVPPDRTYKRVSQALCKMKACGLVVSDGKRNWQLN